MATEARLANTSITTLDPTLTQDVIYERLINIIKHSNIDEIGILPFLPDLDTSKDVKDGSEPFPQYPFILQEQCTKLGIPIFCWVPLLAASYAVLKAAIKNEGSTEKQDWWIDSARRKKVIEATSCLMMVCPDSFTAVNARKRLVEQGVLHAEEELKFLDTILTIPRNCKSSGAWHHRKWLLCYLYPDMETTPLPPAVLEEHLKICHQAAERYPKCYYAWTMRHWLVQELGRHWWAASFSDQAQQLDRQHENLVPLEKEYERMKDHMARNISDHSTQQHLQQCLLQLSGKWTVQLGQNKETQEPSKSRVDALQWTRTELSERQRRRETLCRSCDQDQGRFSRSGICSVSDDVSQSKRASYPWVVRLWRSEMDRTKDLVQSYPGHESLWYHLRFVYYGLRWLDSEPEAPLILSSLKDQDSFVSIATETVFIEQASQSENLEQSTVDQQRLSGERYLGFVRQLEGSSAPELK